jgi:hypothetical protein
MKFSGPRWTDVSWIDFTVFDPDSQTDFGDGEMDRLTFDNLVVRVPEPTSLQLLAAGLLGLAVRRRFSIRRN